MECRIHAIIALESFSSRADLQQILGGLPKALFLVCGQSMCQRQIDAIVRKVPGLQGISIVGPYEEAIFESFCAKAHELYPDVEIRYLRDPLHSSWDVPLLFLKKELEKACTHILVVAGDIYSSLPLNEMVEWHNRGRGRATVLSISPERLCTSNESLGMVCDLETNKINELLDANSKIAPNAVSCGVYLFDSTFFERLQAIADSKGVCSGRRPSERNPPYTLERLLLCDLVNKGELYCHWCSADDFFVQVKGCRSLLMANKLCLIHETPQNPGQVIPSDCEVLPPVYISPDVKIGKNSRLGPYVSIDSDVIIGKGVRIKNSIVLKGARIDNHTCVINSLICWRATLGAWVRVEGIMEDGRDLKLTVGGQKNKSVAVVGKDVKVADEAVLYDCITFPGAVVDLSEHYEIIV